MKQLNWIDTTFISIQSHKAFWIKFLLIKKKKFKKEKKKKYLFAEAAKEKTPLSWDYKTSQIDFQVSNFIPVDEIIP